MQVLDRTIGLNFKGNRATVSVWAPEAKELSVKTESLILPLKPAGRGYWSTTTDKILAGDKYWIVMDGKQFPDPASLAQPEGVHGPSMAVDLQYSWSDKDWLNLPLEDYIIYELHTGTFSLGSNFEGIGQKLDYLLELGITAIEIMPVASFPGERNWGYDGVFPSSVQQSYGGAHELQKLVELCHEKGLAVILDVVYNHVGPEGNYLPEFGPYFTKKYQTPWGEAVNFDDAGSDEVRKFIIENALMWFRDFHVDALRLDAVHAIKDFSASHILQEISRSTDELMKQTGRVHYLIAECDLNDPKYISTIKENGMGMDAQWVDEFHHALRVTAGEPKKGYYSDFSGIGQLAKSFEDAYVYTGTYSEERKRTFGRTASGHPAKQFIVFSQNHDQIGNRMLGERSGSLYSFEMQKLLAASVMLSPFIPLIFMGEEWGASSPFLYFVSHSDEQLIAQVREGRSAEFAAMHENGDAPDPQDENTFQRSKLNWTELESQSHKAMFEWFKTLISLRKNHEILCKSDLKAVRSHVFEDQNCMMVERGIQHGSELILCMYNFSGSVQQLSVPTHISLVQKIVDSATVEGNSPEALQPESFIAYSAKYV